MRSKCKKLITDINRGANIEDNLKEYINFCYSQYNLYSMVKMCMNYYTMKEMLNEQETTDADYIKCFASITNLIKKCIIDGNDVSDSDYAKIKELRAAVEAKMKNLTSYTDGYEVYEYILNRIEGKVLGITEDVDIEMLSAKLFKYVFSENDTVLINSKLQLIMSQLPVRMIKMKFFDIVARTIAIYSGSEKSTLDQFVDMIRTAVLINKPEGFETEYPDLFGLYDDLTKADYENLSKDEYASLNARLTDAALHINEEVSIYMLLQEIINDVYVLLITIKDSIAANMEVKGYGSALNILKACIEDACFEDIPERLMTDFISIEGIQETIYENIMILEAAFTDVESANEACIDKLGLKAGFENCRLIEKLLSTSLFISIDDEEANSELADNDYVNKIKESLIFDLSELFKKNTKRVNRSIMCKVISIMPIFLNSQQEIKDYFDYVLNNCKDDSELAACNKLLCDIMEEE